MQFDITTFRDRFKILRNAKIKNPLKTANNQIFTTGTENELTSNELKIKIFKP